MHLIETSNLTKFYGKARGIKDISLSINEGEVFGFIGPNGAGKSTTIRILLALIRPSSGEAKIAGLDCTKQSKEIKKILGYVPSEVNYYDDMRVNDLLKYSARFYRKDCNQRIKELADRFKLDLHKKIDSLSYGNKKKVAIIQALIHEPRLLIFDEPTGGLDPLMQNIFFETLEEEHKKGTSILFSSHILTEVQRMCDRVAIIKGGQLLKVEHVDELRKNNFKKVQLELGAAAKVNLQAEGITKVEQKGNVVDFLYSGDIKQLACLLYANDISNFVVEDPSLEEIFMHYYK